jgi:hypothetical protein
MEPGMQCVLTQWNPDPLRPAGVRERTDPHDQLKLTGYAVLVVLM